METEKFEEIKGSGDLEGYSFTIKKIDAFHIRQQWFIDHIGKRLFRNSNGCDCPVCESVLNNGTIVEDRLHADYLYDCECDFTSDGHPLRYFETKEEVDEFAEKLGTSRSVTPI